MDENSYQSSSSKKSNTGWIIGIVALIALAIVGGLWFLNRTKIDQLSRQLAQTQQEVQEVQQESQQTKEGVADSLREGADNITDAIGDIKNPAVRLALAKAYAEKLRGVLDAQTEEDLDTILVYVEKNPTVLVSKPAQLPAEVQTAINNVKTKLANARASVATTVADAKEAAALKVGQGIRLEGTITFVADDPVLGGSVFMLTTDEGKKYYLQFNEANSTNVKNSMVGKEVSVQVRITGIEDGDIRFDVISGPTLVSSAPTATKSAAPAQ